MPTNNNLQLAEQARLAELDRLKAIETARLAEQARMAEIARLKTMEIALITERERMAEQDRLAELLRLKAIETARLLEIAKLEKREQIRDNFEPPVYSGGGGVRGAGATRGIDVVLGAITRPQHQR